MEFSEKEVLVLLGALYQYREETFDVQIDGQTENILDERVKKVFGNYMYEEELVDEVLEITNKMISFLLNKLQIEGNE